MTRDEYGDIEDMQPYEEAINMAISALRILDQEPKFIAKSDGTIEQIKNCDDCLLKKEWEKIGKLISVILEKQTEQESCDDCISREGTLTAFSAYVGSGLSMDDFDALWDIVVKMPSVRPIRPKGEWVEKEVFDGDTAYECSECGELFSLIDGTPADNLYNFCPNCGADMRGE